MVNYDERGDKLEAGAGLGVGVGIYSPCLSATCCIQQYDHGSKQKEESREMCSVLPPLFFDEKNTNK